MRSDRLGAFLLRVFLRRLGALSALPVADSLRNDRLSIFQRREPEQMVTSWRLRFSDEATAQLAAEAITRAPPPAALWSVRPQGRDVILLASDRPTDREQFENTAWRSPSAAPTPAAGL